ncbi:MAG: hypothetical protein HZB91_10160 [Elusimicrobia bacterium]|nr:hypothetical protein [Elusimicrobiota bacterium]
MRRAVDAFELEPPWKELSKQSGLPEGSYHVVPWIPHFSEKEIWDREAGRWRPRTPHELKLEMESNRVMVNGRSVSAGIAQAKTRPDGSIVLYQQAFLKTSFKDPVGKAKTPEDLAMVILHETSHWIDAAGQGGFRESDPPWYVFLSETKAYRREAEFASVLGRDASRARDLSSRFNYQMSEASERNLPWFRIREMPGWLIPNSLRSLSPAPATDDEKPGQPEYERIKGELNFLEEAEQGLRAIRERAEADRRAREEAELRRQEDERRQREGENGTAISMLTADEIHLARMRGKQWLAEYDGYKAGMENGMDGCSRELWDMFMRIRARIIENGNIPVIDPSWFDDWFLMSARKAYYYHNPPIGGFAMFMVFAKKACANPGSMTQKDIKELEDIAFPNPRLGLGSSDSFPSHMWPDACPKVLYDDLAQLNNTQPRGWRLNVSWVNWRAGQLIRQGKPSEEPNRPSQPSDAEPEQRNDRIDLPTLDDIIRRLDRE